MKCLIIYDNCTDSIDAEIAYLRNHHIDYSTAYYYNSIDAFAYILSEMKRIDAVRIKIDSDTDEYDLIKRIAKKFDKIIVEVEAKHGNN